MLSDRLAELRVKIEALGEQWLRERNEAES
jgi:hypothetical protein